MLGKDGGEKHWKRIKNALRSKNALRPTLYGLPKDHKPLIPGREEEGPPQRHVCGATESSNGPLSDILSELINKLGDEMERELSVLCYSTEEMCASIEK